MQKITAFEDTWHWGRTSGKRILRTSASIQYRCIRNDSIVAPLLERKRHDGVSYDDGESLARIASGFETDRQFISALRPNRQPLFKDRVGCSIWCRELSE